MKSADSSVTKEAKESKEPPVKESSTKEPKATIPKALREQVWLTHIGRRYEGKCLVPWCKSIIFKPTSLISEIDMLVGEGQIQLLK